MGYLSRSRNRSGRMAGIIRQGNIGRITIKVHSSKTGIGVTREIRGRSIRSETRGAGKGGYAMEIVFPWLDMGSTARVGILLQMACNVTSMAYFRGSRSL